MKKEVEYLTNLCKQLEDVKLDVATNFHSKDSLVVYNRDSLIDELGRVQYHAYKLIQKLSENLDQNPVQNSEENKK